MNNGQERDESLMIRVAQGHAEHLETLIRRYGTLLLSFIRYTVGDRQRSEDIFQDVFLTVWAKRSQYPFPRPFKPWLYKIALNRCRQEFRGRGLGPLSPLDDANPPPQLFNSDPSPPESAIAIENSVLVDRAIAQLSSRQRTVVVLRLWNDLSYAQIAEAMNVREATVRSNMHDALGAIRRHLESQA